MKALSYQLDRGPRKYDNDADEHPCQLVTKYLHNDDDAVAVLGAALLDWLEARKVDVPPAACPSG